MMNIESALSAVAERHYDVRWHCISSTAVSTSSTNNAVVGDQYLLLNANGLVVLGIAPSHPLFQRSCHIVSVTFPHGSVFGAASSPVGSTAPQPTHQSTNEDDIPKSKRHKPAVEVETDAFGNNLRKRDKPVRVQGGQTLAVIRLETGLPIHIICPITAEIMDLNIRLISDFQSLLGSPATSCWDGWFAILSPVSKEERNKMSTAATYNSGMNPDAPAGEETSGSTSLNLLTTQQYIAKYRSA